jgi:hypothetical protein
MNILVFSPFAINTPHFETELEIIQNHLDSGNRITLLTCNGDLLTCDVNLSHNIAVCLKCIGRRIDGVKKLSNNIEIKPIYFLKERDKNEIRCIENRFSSHEELKQYKIGNLDIGFGILSSLISALRDPEPDLIKYRKVIYHNMISSLAIFRSMQNYLSFYNPKMVYVYNGRYAPMRAALKACQSKNVQVLIHEKGSSIYQYALFENTTPHDLSYIEQNILDNWESNPDEMDRNNKAEEYFINRSKGICKTWIPYTKEQNKDLLPEDWDNRRTNIVIYNSSEDEFEAIGEEWKNNLYRNQNEGIKKIIQSLRDDDRIQIYLRIHPNLKNIFNRQTIELDTFSSPNLTVIPADSPISSYALLQNASKVVTFGSSMGIEAAYWGVPSILAGQCYYRNFGATYNPENHDELIQMIYADLVSKKKESALPYGYYFNTFGTPFKYYEAEGIYKGKFKGSYVKENIAYRLSYISLLILYPINFLLSTISIMKNKFSITGTIFRKS